MSAVSVFAEEKALLPPFKLFTVKNDQAEAKSVTVTTTRFVPAGQIYVVRGKVRYENVEGTAYLEMWNVMPDRSRYFSRTLGDFGTMKKITGTSGLRDFELPFNLMDHKPKYVDLEINVVMPGRGVIELSSLTVSDMETVATGEWFSPRTGNIMGGIVGATAGVCCGLFGALCGFLVPRGKGRRWVLGTVLFGFMAGIVMLITGLAALGFGQPYHVWYPFVLIGVIFVFVQASLFFTFRKGYAQAELRKMQALDV